MDNIEAPANFSHSSDGNMITFTWDHVNPSMVDYYEMVMECTDQTGERMVISFSEEQILLSPPFHLCPQLSLHHSDCHQCVWAAKHACVS